MHELQNNPSLLRSDKDTVLCLPVASSHGDGARSHWFSL